MVDLQVMDHSVIPDFLDGGNNFNEVRAEWAKKMDTEISAFASNAGRPPWRPHIPHSHMCIRQLRPTPDPALDPGSVWKHTAAMTPCNSNSVSCADCGGKLRRGVRGGRVPDCSVCKRPEVRHDRINPPVPQPGNSEVI